MKRPGRTALLLLLGSSGLVMAAAAVLVFTVPSFKHAVKERWHRWSCPDVPKARSERSTASAGSVVYREPYPFCPLSSPGQPTLFYDFECPLSTLGQGVLSGYQLSPAIVRRVGDVSDQLTSISAGFMLKCPTTEPDIRIVIRIDHPDGKLLEWNEKRLIAGEHRPNEWERFNFEWILHDIVITPDDLVSVFFSSDDEEVLVDDLSIVFRSAGPLPPTADPHA